jgi:hypothetical protein
MGRSGASAIRGLRPAIEIISGALRQHGFADECHHVTKLACGRRNTAAHVFVGSDDNGATSKPHDPVVE